MSFTPLGDALKQKVHHQRGLKKQLDGVDAVAAATAVFVVRFGNDSSLQPKPLFLKNRTLTVTCSSAAVAQEIRLNQAEIVKEINEKIGSSEVDRIRYLA